MSVHVPYPAAGVMPTSPEMMPEQKPMMLNFCVCMYSSSVQPMPPPHAARFVFTTT